MDLFLNGPVGRLEAKLWEPTDGRAPRAIAVFCHPHPLYGGTMDNKVVFRAARGLQNAGLAVLRFNFRGVRRSEGVHDGKGGEALDLAAAIDHMIERFPGTPLWAGGFSFGSRTAAQRAIVDARIERLVLVALPVLAFDLSWFGEVRQPGLIVMADRDEYGTLSALKQQFPNVEDRFTVTEIGDSGHFFDETTRELEERVRDYAERALGERS